jgi:hypothetical protein
MKARLLLMPMVVMVTLACSAESGTGASPGPTGIPSDGTSNGSLPPGDGGERPPADVLDPVIADAAERTGIDPSQVTIVSATAVAWSDGSLGCPQPGMNYTQALVSGFQIIVRAGEQQLDYRVSGPGRFRLCQNQKP